MEKTVPFGLFSSLWFPFSARQSLHTMVEKLDFISFLKDFFLFSAFGHNSPIYGINASGNPGRIIRN
jgi:hypothetical protein